LVSIPRHLLYGAAAGGLKFVQASFTRYYLIQYTLGSIILAFRQKTAKKGQKESLATLQHQSLY